METFGGLMVCNVLPNECYQFQFGAKEWFKMGSVMGVARHGGEVGCLGYRGRMWIAGGLTEKKGPPVTHTEWFISDPSGGGSWLSGPSLPEAMSCQAMTMVSESEVLIAGGRRAEGVDSNKVFLYDAKEETFVKMAPMKEARFAHLQVIFNHIENFNVML